MPVQEAAKNPTPSNLTTPTTPGGGSIDMTNERDRGLVRQAIKNWPRRWRKLSPEFLDKMVDDLEWARQQAMSNPATEDDPLNGAKVILSVVKTVAMMEGQHQIDDHKQDTNDRLDAGKNTANVGHTIKVEFDNAG